MSYTSTIEEVNSTRKKFKINVDKTLVSQSFGRAVNEVQKTAQIKGFRKGKVPLALVKKFYMNDVRKKAIESLVDETYRKAAAESALQIVSYPSIDKVGEFEENVDFEFEATVDVNPQVEMKDYKGLKVKLEKAKVPILDEQVAQTRKNFLRNSGSIQSAGDRSTVEKGDFLTLDYQLLENGTPLKGQKRTGARLTLDGSNLPEVEQGLTSAKVDETTSFGVTFPETHSDEALKGKTLTFEATVRKIEVLQEPALDETFVKKFGFQTVEDFEKSLSETVANSVKKQRLTLLKDEMVSKILDANPFDVPESLIESTIDRMIMEVNSRLPKQAQIKTDDAKVRDSQRERATREVKGVLALGHIARAEKIEIDEASVAQEISTFAAQSGISPQEVLKRYGSQVIEEFRGKVLIDKVVEFLAEQAEVQEV